MNGRNRLRSRSGGAAGAPEALIQSSAGALRQHDALMQRLMNPSAYRHPVGEIRRVDTHVSTVLLTGAHAYKFKKPVDLGFLDYSTAEKRRRACQQELVLNRRLAPELYLDLATVVGSRASPHMGGKGRVLAHAVRMKQFPAAAEGLEALSRGTLTDGHVEQLAMRLADFHAHADRAAPRAALGGMAMIRRQTLQNVDVLLTHPLTLPHRSALERLHVWTLATLATFAPVFRQRKAGGFIREGHGDLHLGNLALVNDQLLPFDCIEFSRELRVIDVMSDVAFLHMDLIRRERADLAQRLLNVYLQYSGDYSGLSVLKHYGVYRALVRAKIACLQVDASGGDSRERAQREVQELVELALKLTAPPVLPRLILMHGLSGSGKSHVARLLGDHMDAVWLRSDIERKRLAALPLTSEPQANAARGLYGPGWNRRVYAHLAGLSAQILMAGRSVIVDASFLSRADRKAFAGLAAALDVPCRLVSCEADRASLERRVRERGSSGADVSDATVEVLESQYRTQEPLDSRERHGAVMIRTDWPMDVPGLAHALSHVCA